MEMFARAKAVLQEVLDAEKIKLPDGSKDPEKIHIVEMEDDFLDGLQKLVVKIGEDIYDIDVPTKDVQRR